MSNASCRKRVESVLCVSSGVVQDQTHSHWSSPNRHSSVSAACRVVAELGSFAEHTVVGKEPVAAQATLGNWVG